MGGPLHAMAVKEPSFQAVGQLADKMTQDLLLIRREGEEGIIQMILLFLFDVFYIQAVL